MASTRTDLITNTHTQRLSHLGLVRRSPSLEVIGLSGVRSPSREPLSWRFWRHQSGGNHNNAAMFEKRTNTPDKPAHSPITPRYTPTHAWVHVCKDPPWSARAKRHTRKNVGLRTHTRAHKPLEHLGSGHHQP